MSERTLEDLTDAELVLAYRSLPRWQQGKVCVVLDARYRKSLGGLLLRQFADRDDVGHVINMALTKALQAFCPSHEKGTFQALLYRAAANYAKDLRKGHPLRYAPKMSSDSLPGFATPSDSSLMRSDPMLIERVLQHARASHMETIILLRMEGNTFSEIGKALGLSSQVVQKRLYKLRDELIDIVR